MKNITAPFSSLNRVFLTAAFLAAAILVVSPAAALMNIQFNSPSVSAAQVSAGGEVVFFYIGHEVQGELTRRSTHVESVTDSDQDGLVSFNSGNALVSGAIWGVVDVTTGDVVMDSPGPTAPMAVTVDPAVLTASPGVLEDTRQSLHLLVVRPGVGAWHGSSFDGAASDAGVPDDGHVVLDLDDLGVLIGSTTLARKFEFKSGDVLVGMDAEFLTYFTVTLP